MKRSLAFFTCLCVLAGCSHRNLTPQADPPVKVSDAKLAPDELPALCSLIGKQWQEVWKRLSADGVTILGTRKAQDGTSAYILRNIDKKFGNVRLFVKDGVIDEVEAWAENGLTPYFSTVVGAVRPGVLVENIEKQHGKPVYVEYGRHGLRMKGWKIDDYLIFVTSNDGMSLTHTAGRVFAFHKNTLASTGRMGSLKQRTTLQALMDGKTHIEKR